MPIEAPDAVMSDAGGLDQERFAVEERHLRLEDAEREELIRLRTENETLRQRLDLRDEKVQKLELELDVELQQNLSLTEIIRR